jgi:hypothetical protein
MAPIILKEKKRVIIDPNKGSSQIKKSKSTSITNKSITNNTAIK